MDKTGTIVFLPPEQRPRPGMPVVTKSPPVAPSVENARLLLLRAMEVGTIVPSIHFTERCHTRDFSMIDAENIIESGQRVAGPIDDVEYRCWKYEFYKSIEGRGWKLIVALDWDSELPAFPHATYVSVHRMSNSLARNKAEKLSKGEQQ